MSTPAGVGTSPYAIRKVNNNKGKFGGQLYEWYGVPTDSPETIRQLVGTNDPRLHEIALDQINATIVTRYLKQLLSPSSPAGTGTSRSTTPSFLRFIVPAGQGTPPPITPTGRPRGSPHGLNQGSMQRELVGVKWWLDVALQASGRQTPSPRPIKMVDDRAFVWCHGSLNALALLFMAAGIVVGSVMENGISVACLTAGGTVVKGWNDFKKFSLKVDMCRFAYSTYDKTLIELRTYARGLPMDELEGFLIKMQTLDDTIIDFAPPLADKYIQEYERLFCCDKSEDTPSEVAVMVGWEERNVRPEEGGSEVELSRDVNIV
ncbi:hypothetical protein ACROYT_G026248 [Oculina patagonica]